SHSSHRSPFFPSCTRRATLSPLLAVASLLPPPAASAYMTRRPPSPTLFPYTTLFRSSPRPDRRSGSFPGWGSRVRRSSAASWSRSEEHTSELQSRFELVCRLLLEKKKII